MQAVCHACQNVFATLGVHLCPGPADVAHVADRGRLVAGLDASFAIALYEFSDFERPARCALPRMRQLGCSATLAAEQRSKSRYPEDPIDAGRPRVLIRMAGLGLQA